MFKQRIYTARTGDIICFREKFYAVRKIDRLRRQVTLLPVQTPNLTRRSRHFVCEGSPETYRISTVQEEATRQCEYTVLTICSGLKTEAA